MTNKNSKDTANYKPQPQSAGINTGSGNERVKAPFKSGFCAIVGRPNAGKSTLLNAFVGEKVSIVSPKPQTTRNKIAGILTTDSYQVIFEDTPGVIKKEGKLSEFMKKSIDSAGSETDVLLIVIDGNKGVTDIDIDIIERFKTKSDNIFYLVNKTDEAGADRIMPALKKLGELGLSDIYPISARNGENVALVLSKIVERLPEGVMFYPQDMITDKTQRFMVSEIIREKALYYYQQEIPHGVGISIMKFAYDPVRKITDIDAEIYCERSGHKAIIIGKGGAALKKLGEAARADIEKLIDTKVFLELWVKVKENWRESDYLLKELGYDKKNI